MRLNNARPMRAGLRTRAAAAAVIAALVLASCGGGDTRGDEDEPGTGNGTGSGTGTEDPVPAQGDPGIDVSNGAFSLQSSNSTATLVEGENAISVTLNLSRQDGHDLPVNIGALTPAAVDGEALTWSFSDETLDTNDTSTTLLISLDYSVAPIASETRSLRIIATDGVNTPLVSELDLLVESTDRPDIYLLVGQSNMVGFSQLDARQLGPGAADEPDTRIAQLNATGNFAPNFVEPSHFTDPSRLAAPDPRYPIALDPLHEGFNVSIGGKAAERIGPGLSFAKAALADTEAQIILVPAAWEDSGFCSRTTNNPEALGWLAQAPDNDTFSGTLLHDRAIARANLAIAETGGILRGILWHQGEADSDNDTCAAAYADNLRTMVASFRSNIMADARGPAARGADAAIPFVVATMSKGNDERGSQSPFSERKNLVDAAHRNVASNVPFSAVVNADDLVPPSYPCGEGSCIHFGAAALREMGARYYERLRSLVDSQ